MLKINNLSGFGGRQGPEQYLVSLLHFDGADESTTFTDQKGKVWTGFSTARIRNDSPTKHSGHLLMDNGVSSYISTPYSSDFWPDVDISVDLWYYLSGQSPGTACLVGFRENVTTGYGFEIYINSAGTMFVQATGGFIASSVLSWGTGWYHIRYCKDGSGSHLYRSAANPAGGDTSPRVATGSLSFGSVHSLPLRIGRNNDGSYNGNGRYDEFAFFRGIALNNGSSCNVPSAPWRL
jgi:hypothetical protein